MQLVTEGKVLQFQNSPTAETARNGRDDGTRMFKHAQNTMAAEPKTLDFSALSEFSVATLVGVAPLNYDSGTLRGRRTVWGGRANLWTALYMGTLVGVRYNPGAAYSLSPTAGARQSQEGRARRLHA
jgi:hypothetical protein